MEIQLKHILAYSGTNVLVKYKGITNGKELGEYIKEDQALDIFDHPERDRPEEVYGWKTGLIKKVETYLKFWKIRVGNGHKNIHACDFGKDAFLVLRPLPDLTDKFYWDNLMDGDYVISKEDIQEIIETPRGLRKYWQTDYLFKHHFDVFGLIEKGLAVDFNTL
jgi:hypothetical protein